MLTRRGLVGGATAFTAIGQASASVPAPRGLRGEADAIRSFAERTHPRGLEAANDREWRVRWADVHRNAPNYSAAAYVRALRHALSWFRDGHTTILPFEFLGAVPEPLRAGPFGLDLPLQARPFHDGLFIAAAKAEALPLLGARVTRVQGRPIGPLVEQFAQDWPSENPAWAHNWSRLLINSWGTLKGFLPEGDTLAIEGVNRRGETVTATLTPRAGAKDGLAQVSHADSMQEAHAQQFGRGNYVARLPNSSAAYVSIEAMEDTARYSLIDLTREVLGVARDPEVSKLIIDLRRNGGGDNYLSEPLRHELARSSFNREGRLFVLTSPQTFSAAQNFANRLERETLAVFVGEPTGSAPNLHGDPQFFVGEQTGITAMVSVLRWQDGGPHDQRRWIFPDVSAPETFGDWIAGIDRAVEAALEYAHTGGDTFSGRARYFERQSQAGAWDVFWRA